MSGTLPASPGFATVGLSSAHRTLVSTAHSGRRLARRVGGHLWRFTARYPPMSRDQFAPVFAFLLAQRGRFDAFEVVPPDLATPRGSAGGTPLVWGGGQTGTTLNVDGLPASTAGWLKAGDVFKLNGHAKVYMLTADADTDAFGATVLQFAPALVQSPADNEFVVVVGVPFTVALTNDVQEYRVQPPLLYAFEIDLEEVI